MPNYQNVSQSRVQSVIGRGQFLPLRLSRSSLFEDPEITRMLHGGNLPQPPPRCQHRPLAAAVEAPSAGVSMVRSAYDTRILAPRGASIMYFHPGLDEYLVFNPVVGRAEDISAKRNTTIIEKGTEIAGDVWRRIRALGKVFGYQGEITVVETQNSNSFTTVDVPITSRSLNPLKFALTRLFNQWFPERWLSSKKDSLLLRFSIIVSAK